MSERAEKESRTEPASDKRLQDSIERGQSPIAREVVLAASLWSIAVVLVYFATEAAVRISGGSALIFQEASTIRLSDGSNAQWLVNAILIEIVTASAPILIVIGLIGSGASLVQARKLFVLERFKFDIARLSPSGGIKRILAFSNLQEFARSLFKLALVAIIGTIIARRHWTEIINLFDKAPSVSTTYLAKMLGQLAVYAAVGVSVWAIFDVPLVISSWRRGLRMSQQEVRDERKELDGDPTLRARRRAIARSRARKRQMAAVPRATLMVVNPTHYAVALRYVRTEGGAPIVVAKGRDLIALAMRSIAIEHDIPLIEDRALARSLHDSVKIDQMIPPEFYRAIADILIVLQRRG